MRASRRDGQHRGEDQEFIDAAQAVLVMVGLAGLGKARRAK